MISDGYGTMELQKGRFIADKLMEGDINNRKRDIK